jgi:hypothetical protein
MFVILAAGTALVTLIDSSIWVPKRNGLGYTLDWSKGLSWVLLAYIVGVLVIVLYGATHPDAPAIRALMQLLLNLTGQK